MRAGEPQDIENGRAGEPGPGPTGYRARMTLAPLNVLAIEPWLGGSHARFLETWRRLSGHKVEILGLPARHWQWRMEAAAFTLAQRVGQSDQTPDVIVASDYVDLPRLRGFLPPHLRSTPVLLYLHENQLTYPDQDPDPDRNHYGFTNVLSCLAADAIAFNSRFHRQDFHAAARALLQRLPSPTPRKEFDEVMANAQVIYPGIDLDALPLGAGPPPDSPLRLAFNHRWEHDKDPVGFLNAVLEVREAGAQIEVVMLGESFERTPDGMAERLERLGSTLLWSGFKPDQAEYARALGECDLVVSTARHEFYGIALLEGLACGCSPLAPNRLAYPEHLPAEDLYADRAGLCAALTRAATRVSRWRSSDLRAGRRELAQSHAAEQTALRLDAACEALRGGSREKQVARSGPLGGP